jgi:hypothetical protein
MKLIIPINIGMIISMSYYTYHSDSFPNTNPYSRCLQTPMAIYRFISVDEARNFLQQLETGNICFKTQ